MAANETWQSALKGLIDRHPVVSFDVFDTLLVRPYALPADLFIHLENLHEAKDFAYARLTGEQMARKRQPGKEDITFDSIYDEFGAEYAFMQQNEMDLEKRILTANPDMLPIFKYAIEQGKRVVLISDMYLPRAVIEDALHQNGFTGYEKLYLSGEVFLMKHTGNLFLHAFRDLAANPREVLHIGDNYHSDCLMAAKSGANTFQYPKIMDRLLEKNYRARVYHDSHRIDLGASITLGVLARAQFLGDQDYWTRFGYDYAGPVIFAYMTWLKQQVKAKGIDKVLFVARDGFTLKKVFDLLAEADGDVIDTAYVYANRNQQSILNLDFEQKVKQDPIIGLSTVKRIIEFYRDRDAVLRDASPAEYTMKEGADFILENIDRYMRLAIDETKAYEKYIGDFLDRDDIAMVDTLSIHLSSQKLLDMYCKKKGVKLHGFYWALVNRDHDDQHTVEAFQPERGWQTHDWDVFEFLITSPEPPIDHVRDGQPVYRELPKEEEYRSQVYPRVSEGAVLFAREGIKALNGVRPFISNRAATDWINILCTHPTDHDRDMVWNIRHAYDSNNILFVPICKPWYTYLLRTKSYRLFNILPVAKSKRVNADASHSVLGIPLIRQKSVGEKTVFRLFNLFPLLGVTRERDATEFRLFDKIRILGLKH